MNRNSLPTMAFLATLLLVCAVVFGTILGLRQGPLDPPGYVNMRGQKAPAFEATALNGAAFGTQRLQRPLIVEFFATWCNACQGEVGVLDRVAHDLHGKADIVAINASAKGLHEAPETVADLRSFRHLYNATYPVAFDPTAAIAKAYNVGSYPQIVVIRRDGVVEYNMAGTLPPEMIEKATQLAHADVSKTVSGQLSFR
jgi:thiol-disulfide isomerase/thioredoxin